MYSGYQPVNSNAARFAENVTVQAVLRARATATNMPITLGAVRFGDGGCDDYGYGQVNWCKVWYDDLGDTNARALAAWCHETLRMEYCGTGRYRLAGQGVSARASMSFVANNLLEDRGYWMNSTNTNAGGWDQSAMRAFCNGRLFKALPPVWQSMVKKVKINASAGNQSTEIVVSEDSIYLLSNREVGGYTTEPYASEGEQISWFTTLQGNADHSRLKFKKYTVSNDAIFFRATSDPSAIAENNVKPGDIWVNGSNSWIGYMYVTKDEITKYGLTPYANTADGKGGWISAVYWWERSPYASNSTYFMFVGSFGSPYSANAYYVNGVCPCFSI